MIRNDSQADQIELAANSRVPVINGLSDQHHPCQLLADMQTWFEHRGDPRGKTAAWIGDGNNNVCHSFIAAAVMRSAENKSELQSRMRISNTHFCLKKNQKPPI